MINYILFSLFIHTAICISLIYTKLNNISKEQKVSINIIDSQKNKDSGLILPSHIKYANRGRGTGGLSNHEKVDMTDYANRLKTIVDPVWAEKLSSRKIGGTLFLTTEVLIFPDHYGNIVSVKINQSSGNREFDQLAIDAVNDAGQFPRPPESLTKDGILWSFSTDERR